ncbi:SDR family oxidoreductase [Nitratireductor basaltis]|uniref:NAD-dependent epimerase/dehydratase n=1 Tax=Nitratireductor basaltis TaxID=472175 RepID=A0A084U5Q2_9HYPH|nr:SDR family oxidoreductase [Nitratireductor basaltis]KFB08288.1 NAD-dependent epimerase/dehydratase [Nitratireductor basaltis]
MKRVLLLGAGYSARAIARALPAVTTIQGTTRSREKAAVLRDMGIEPLLHEAGQGLSEDLHSALESAHAIFVSVAPNASGDPLLQDLEAASVQLKAASWLCYLSTVGVYGDHAGAWIDENAECRPVSDRSRQRLAAEQAWQTYAMQKKLPLAILRLAGIYGPGRSALDSLRSGKARRIIKPGQVFNRIHVEDIAGAALHLMQMRASGVFNVADDEPAPPQDVIAFAASLLGMAPPPEIPFDEAPLSPLGRSFYGECKRVSNRHLKGAGYRFAYPDYRAGLKALFTEEGA